MDLCVCVSEQTCLKTNPAFFPFGEVVSALGHNITRITHSRNIYFNANVKMFFCKLYKKYIYFLFFIRYVSEVSN